MFKRMILFVLSITTVPAIIMSFPVLADEELRITLQGSELSDVTRFQVVNAENPNEFLNYSGPFDQDEVIFHNRDSNVIFRMIYEGVTTDCTVLGRNDNTIPLTQNDEVIDAVTVETTVSNNNFNCVTRLPIPTESDLQMIVDVDESITLPSALTVTDYNASHGELGYSKDYPVSSIDSSILHPIYLDASYSTITNEAYDCKFTNGTEEIMHTAPNDSKVYISLLPTSCVLSLTPPDDDDGGSEPPPPPPSPGDIAITDCAGLAQIKNNLNGNYYLANSLSGCSPVAVTGTFTGSFNGQSDLGYSISNSTITPNDSNGMAALFEKTEGAEITNFTFNNITVKDGSDMRGLIAGVAAATKFENIRVTTLTIEGGDSNNIYPAGGIAGRSQYGTHLINVHINGAKITKNGYAGGLIGRAFSDTTIEKSSVRGFSSGTGKNDCKGAANGECGVGGLIGQIKGDTTSHAFTVTIKESSATGEIKTQKNAGGLVGFIAETKSGAAKVNIENSYAIVNIPEVGNSAGGLIGSAVDSNNKDISLNYVYAAGKVNLSNANKGKGVVGGKDGAKTYGRVTGANTLYDYQTTGQDSSGITFATKMASDSMKTATPFGDWNSSSIWKFTSGQYPSLLSDPENKQ